MPRTVYAGAAPSRFDASNWRASTRHVRRQSRLPGTSHEPQRPILRVVAQRPVEQGLKPTLWPHRKGGQCSSHHGGAVHCAPFRRVRLKYGTSPIIDFGIAKGAVEIKWQDRLAYCDGTGFWNGHDPEDHYWLYFRTGQGETVMFDPALYTFNCGIVVDSTPYTAGFAPNILPGTGVAKFVPGFFMGRDVNKNTIGIHRAWECISVLRNETLHRAIRNVGGPHSNFTTADLDSIVNTCSGSNHLLPHSRLDMASFILWSTRAIDDVVSRKAWVHWPDLDNMPLAIDDEDPNTDPNRADEKCMKTLKHLTKKYKAGKMDRETSMRG